MAAQDIAVLFQMLRKMDTKPEFNTPDTREVDKTSHRHPLPQCRLDTYFHGALCNISHEIDVDKSDATIGTCNRVASLEHSDEHESDDDEAKKDIELPEHYGTRPRCWYKPSNVSTPTFVGSFFSIDEVF